MIWICISTLFLLFVKTPLSWQFQCFSLDNRSTWFVSLITLFIGLPHFYDKNILFYKYDVQMSIIFIYDGWGKWWTILNIKLSCVISLWTDHSRQLTWSYFIQLKASIRVYSSLPRVKRWTSRRQSESESIVIEQVRRLRVY